jgi:hypothetical protein
MRLRSIVAMTLLLAATAAPAATLCRDSKGLFTPCPPGTARKASHRSEADDPAASADPQNPTKSERSARKTRNGPELFARGKLCRDSKGLATPCPR